ncbi:MAG: hypothetical protein ACOVRB_09305, partial [Akkermansiaceae bacterium]
MTFIISRHLLWIAIVFVSCLQAQTFDLNGATGQIFHVDLAKREFVLLKATEFAPQSDVGKSRFTVHWTEKTSIINVEERSDFSGIVGPVSAQFQEIDLAKVVNESPVFDKWLHEEYGMVLDIHAFDIGFVDGENFTAVLSELPCFREQFPNGLDRVDQIAKKMNTRHGHWGGPDGFGDTPESEKARIDMMTNLCVALEGKHGVEGVDVAVRTTEGKLIGAPNRSTSSPSNPWEFVNAKKPENQTFCVPLT